MSKYERLLRYPLTMSRHKLITACLVFAVANSLAAAVVKIPVSVRGGFPAGQKYLQAKLRLRIIEPSGSIRDAGEIPLDVPGVGILDTPPNGTLMVEVVAPGFWHPPQSVTTDRSGELSFDLWPTGTLKGIVKVGPGEELPQALDVRFQSAPAVSNADRLPVTQVKCPVTATGAWSCEIPAGLVDLRFHARRYLSEFRWDYRLAPRELQDIGLFKLRRGSAVYGTVTLPRRFKGRLEDTRVVLEPVSHADRREDATRSGMRALGTTANSRGLFYVDSVAPGEYSVFAVNDKGLRSAAQRVRVIPDAEVELVEPLELRPPKSLTFSVTPPADPHGESWKILVLAAEGPGGRYQIVAHERMSDKGEWSGKNLRTGRYGIKIESQSGGAWLYQQLDVDADSPEIISVVIPTVEVRGTVTLGERPLIAKVYFGGESGAVSIPMESNEKGEFGGVLPVMEHGVWPEVSIVGTVPPVKRTLRGIKVERGDGAEFARVDLSLPDTYLSGEIVDQSGASVAPALVNVANEADEPLIQIDAEKDGTFEIHGLPPGAFTLQASAFLQESDPTPVQLEEEGRAEHVRLEVRSLSAFRGRVVSSVGLVAGARVTVTPTDTRSLVVVPTRTNASGNFEIHIPAGTREVNVAVEAPGFAFKMFHQRVPEKGGIEIPLDQLGGTLIVECPEFDGSDSSPQPFLVHSGADQALLHVGSRTFDKVPREGFMRLRALMIERGQYTVCAVQPRELATLRAGQLPEKRCASGFLPPLGELTLTIAR